MGYTKPIIFNIVILFIYWYIGKKNSKFYQLNQIKISFLLIFLAWISGIILNSITDGDQTIQKKKRKPWENVETILYSLTFILILYSLKIIQISESEDDTMLEPKEEPKEEPNLQISKCNKFETLEKFLSASSLEQNAHIICLDDGLDDWS